MKFKGFFILLIGCLLMLQAASSEALIMINEILADPSSTAGDANGDGIISRSQDEFIELFNLGSTSVDISGWYLTDADKVRNIFEVGTILAPNDFFVVFGGGNPSSLDINWQTASTGFLSLNNTGDTITLFNSDDVQIDKVTYGKLGGKDQSLTRLAKGTDEDFILHSLIVESEGRLFSPGTHVNGKPIDSITTPELSTYVYFLMGGIVVLLRRSRKLYFLG